MSKRRESNDQLRQRILAAMQKDIGITEKMARPFIDSVMQCFAGERTYFPALTRSYPMNAIQLALERGESRAEVCRKFDISRAQLYRLFPGGSGRV